MKTRSTNRKDFPDLIFISLEDWDEVWRRNQYFVSKLAERHLHLTILFVERPFDIQYAIRSFFPKYQRKKLDQFLKGLEPLPSYLNIYTLTTLKLLPNFFRITRKFNRIFEKWQITRAARKLGMSEFILWINALNSVEIIDNFPQSRVIYDITDDWRAFPQPQRNIEQLIADDDKLTQRADLVIVCSEHLYEMKKEAANRIALIPNGVELSFYENSNSEKATAALETLPRPILGYIGTLHPQRVDVNLLCYVAERMPSTSIVLVGPSDLTNEDKEKLKKYLNVYLWGPIEPREVATLNKAFDVCLLPHLVNDFTNSLNPIKLYEYLASGKPIVATNVAGFKDHPSLILIAQDAEDFVRKISQVLASDNPKMSKKRMNEARKHSWDHRVDMVEKEICLLLKKWNQ